MPLATFYKNHGYSTFILLADSVESKHIESQLAENGFEPVQTIHYESDSKKLRSIEDYIAPEDYIHAVNQTYMVKLRHEGYVPVRPEDISTENGIVNSLCHIWKKHAAADWGDFDHNEITEYICNKISLGEATFLSENTRDNFRTLYRAIAERIRIYSEPSKNGYDPYMS